MGDMAYQITSITIVYSSVYSDADQRLNQSSASLASVWGIHRWPVNSPHKGQWRGKCFHLMTSSWNDTGSWHSTYQNKGKIKAIYYTRHRVHWWPDRDRMRASGSTVLSREDVFYDLLLSLLTSYWCLLSEKWPRYKGTCETARQ